VDHKRRATSQTVAVLAALTGETWRHGYDLAKETGLKSGTLYPILVRLADRGVVEARWEEEQPAGRPRRHLYRLTAEGRAEAEAVVADARAAAGAREPAPPTRRRSSRPRLASEGA
jgi:PadR family transcriptional regulator, regulatory protein PadR